ncbi:MAG TPA: pirin family protein [Solirubrobacteraceae bacterium]|nr:pirin family protein [Solirubrobacteraceae bacterium]
MTHLLPADATPPFVQGPFVIRRIHPGLIDGRPTQDPVVGPLAIVDHATLGVGTLVNMHEHRNDEILSYIWRGTMIHEDSTGQRIPISPQKLMMMNAGRSFWHEESTPDEPVEMLQIFVRPEAADLDAGVHFYDRPADFRDGRWNHIGGPAGSGAPLTIRNQVHVYDIHPSAGDRIEVPTAEGMRQWVYVMDGEIELGGQAVRKGDAISDLTGDLPPLTVTQDATVVAFLADPDAGASLAGSISGYGGR